MLLEGHRADDANAAGTRRAALQRGDRGGERRAAAPGDVRRRGEPLRQRHVVDVLDEQRVGPAGRQHADRLGGHRPAGQPLHRGAEAVGAAIDEVIEAGLRQHGGDDGAPPPHLLVAEPRVFGLVNGPQRGRQHEAGGFTWPHRLSTHDVTLWGWASQIHFVKSLQTEPGVVYDRRVGDGSGSAVHRGPPHRIRETPVPGEWRLCRQV